MVSGLAWNTFQGSILNELLLEFMSEMIRLRYGPYHTDPRRTVRSSLDRPLISVLALISSNLNLYKYGHAAFCRQTLLGGNYGLLQNENGVIRPNPDFWAADLFNQLMIGDVLNGNLCLY